MDLTTIDAVEAVICIPTFRRPDWLERTLRSVMDQIAPFGFAVVVVDNDAANPAGAERARLVLQSQTPHSVLVESNQGNCHAINRAFRAALTTYPSAEFFLMIDDDEVAMPGWLEAMVNLAKEKRADIVGGPVLRQFDVPVAASVSGHPLFLSIAGSTRQVSQIHGSGNCLIRRRVFDAMPKPPFDIRFNFLGGGDMEFFTRCRVMGFSTWWCAEAIATEFVPAERVTPKFLTRRSIRTGSINYVVDRMHAPGWVMALKNIGSLGLGLGRGLAVLLRTRSPLQASHPVLMPVGRIIASLGFIPQPYKSSQ
ncbi:glycosyltransferase family 2 protein [Devosia psychrophila]|uniref:Glycosyl transferase family A n=1 Tax=Devosia psychrophila TaxID=728005 RepID=A0A0F5PYY3_9HYPH|nr:glycosyltransferase family 2 protein [Devosia psychrophila]KKC33820.1 glycosyl transferase family A [Devosia psychrophila]SFD37790.1 Glycosyltransferase, GT2 family [Devosia psychrophila]